jgi:ankyrin repeat protein
LSSKTVFAFVEFFFMTVFSQNTPLHWASRSGHLEVANLLVSFQADVAAVNKCARQLPHLPLAPEFLFCSEGKTPLQLAIARSKSAVVEYLRSIGAP